MEVVVVEVWVKVEVEVEWMDDVSVENSILSTKQYSAMRPIPLPRCRSKEVQSMDYIQDLISLDL